MKKIIKITIIAAFCILLATCSKPVEEPLLNNPSPECLSRAALKIKDYRESKYGEFFTYELYKDLVDYNKKTIKEECNDNTRR